MFKKFKGHYSKRKTHKTDRDVMSYEDMVRVLPLLQDL